MPSGYTVIHICNTQVNMYTNIQLLHKQLKEKRGNKIRWVHFIKFHCDKNFKKSERFVITHGGFM
jgi:hypothetical protein